MFSPVRETALDHTVTDTRVLSSQYYGTYHGHTQEHLGRVYSHLREKEQKRRFVWLAGDSSLDCKHWLLNERRRPALNGYERVLEPPQSVPDVCYHMNAALVKGEHKEWACVMTAVEATLLGDRLTALEEKQPALKQDAFLASTSGRRTCWSCAWAATTSR